jgi:hypothetical protein
MILFNIFNGLLFCAGDDPHQSKAHNSLLFMTILRSNPIGSFLVAAFGGCAKKRG